MIKKQSLNSWVLALSEEVNNENPIGVDCGEYQIALWRDKQGKVKGVEDRCPHRRVQLSLGCVLPNGNIRCAYHGWSFSSETGALQNIPNIKDQNKFSPAYRTKLYSVWEESGLVRYSLDDQPPLATEDETLPVCGTTTVSLSHSEYLNTFFDAPGLMFSISGVKFTEYLHSDPHEVEGRIEMERLCNWAGWNSDTRFTSDFPLILWSATHPETGETEIKLLGEDRQVLVQAVIAPNAASRGTTSIRWRAGVYQKGAGWRKLFLSRRKPIIIKSSIDGEALRTILPSASVPFNRIRNEIAGKNETVDVQIKDSTYA